VLSLVSVPRALTIAIILLPLFGAYLRGECRLPDVAPETLAQMSAGELIDSGHYLRAVRILEPVAKQRPDDAKIAWLLSLARAELGDLDSALALAEQALAGDQSNAAYHLQVAAVAGRMAEKAGLLKKLTFGTRAKKELDATAALDPVNTGAQWGLMMFYFAAPPLIGGDKERARQIGEKLAAAAPLRGRYYQGRLAIELKEYDQAEAFFQQAALADPLFTDNALALAKFYIETRPDAARAERWACQAVHADPARTDGWALLARADAMCGCWTEAAEVVARAESIDPDNLAPSYALALQQIEQNEHLEPATALLRRYLERPIEGGEPTEAKARLELGRALGMLGRNAEALPELKAAVELDPALEGARAEMKRVAAAEGRR
jgi:tetratricopeptide (TPR) repeat protein